MRSRSFPFQSSHPLTCFAILCSPAGSVDSSYDHADESAKKGGGLFGSSGGGASSSGDKKKGGFRSLFGKK